MPAASNICNHHYLWDAVERMKIAYRYYRSEVKVLLDGEPAVGAYVEFVQKNPSDASRKISPTCTVDEKGEYLLSTYAMGDGIPEGEYQCPGPLACTRCR